jgi:sec-independent protein translocase protein TatA
MGALQPMHMAIVALVALLVFGPKRLPELAKGIGEAVREFKKTTRGGDISDDLLSGAPPAVATRTGAYPE